MIRDLGIDQPVKDPTTMAPDELLAEIREIIKQLLAYGARFPKVLMLYVKDLLFLDGALATLAPDVDLFAGGHPHRHLLHGSATASASRPRSASTPASTRSIWTACGPSSASQLDVEQMTYRDLQARRELIRKRMEDHRRRR